MLISEVESGRGVVVPALIEVERSGALSKMESRAERSPDGWTLYGEKVFVQFANVASHILVPLRTNAGGLTVFLIPRADVEIAFMENASNIPIFQVNFEGVKVSDDSRVGAVDGALPDVEAAIDRAQVLRCVEVAGAGEFILELCLDYAQFRAIRLRDWIVPGRPISLHGHRNYDARHILLACSARPRSIGRPYAHELGAFATTQSAPRALSSVARKRCTRELRSWTNMTSISLRAGVCSGEPNSEMTSSIVDAALPRVRLTTR